MWPVWERVCKEGCSEDPQDLCALGTEVLPLCRLWSCVQSQFCSDWSQEEGSHANQTPSVSKTHYWGIWYDIAERKLILIVSVASFVAKSSFPRKITGNIAELTQERSPTSANCVESVSTVPTTWRDTRTVCIAIPRVQEVFWSAPAVQAQPRHSLPTTRLQVLLLIPLLLLAGNQH